MVYEGEVLIRSVQGGLTSQLLAFNTFRQIALLLKRKIGTMMVAIILIIPM